MIKRISILIVFIIASMTLLYGEPLSAIADVIFSFDDQSASNVEFGFTGNTVTSMSSSVSRVELVMLKETSANSYTFTLETNLNAYWRVLSTSNLEIKIQREASLDDVDSTDPLDVIPFNMTCGGLTIPANEEVVIYSHTASLEPRFGYLPISVTTQKTDNLNASYYRTELKLILSSI